MNFLIIVGVLLVIALPIVCLEIGYRYGVKETERRWSEAVYRAEQYRKLYAPDKQS